MSNHPRSGGMICFLSVHSLISPCTTRLTTKVMNLVLYIRYPKRELILKKGNQMRVLGVSAGIYLQRIETNRSSALPSLYPASHPVPPRVSVMVTRGKHTHAGHFAAVFGSGIYIQYDVCCI